MNTLLMIHGQIQDQSERVSKLLNLNQNREFTPPPPWEALISDVLLPKIHTEAENGAGLSQDGGRGVFKHPEPDPGLWTHCLSSCLTARQKVQLAQRLDR